MSAPIHKTCYRCDAAIAAFVDPVDPLGGKHGICAGCALTVAADEVAREWRMAHPEQFDPVAEIPRENNSGPGGSANESETNGSAPALQSGV